MNSATIKIFMFVCENGDARVGNEFSIKGRVVP
jgi:hypothetical protein